MNYKKNEKLLGHKPPGAWHQRVGHSVAECKQALFDFLFGTAARKTIAALMDQGVVSVASFATGMIIGRICTKEEFGLYMLGLTIITIAMNFQEDLISTPYMIFSPRLEGLPLFQYTGSILVHQLVYSVAIILLLVLSYAVLALGFGPPGLETVVLALIFVISFILLRHFARNVSLAALRMKNAMFLDGIVSALQVGGLFLLAHLKILSASMAYWVIGAACIAGLLPWFLTNRNEIHLMSGQSRSHLRQNLAIGKWIFVSGFLWTLGTSVYPWLLAVFHGTASTGVWAACLGIIGLLNPLLFGLQKSFGPRIAHAYANRGRLGLRGLFMQASVVFAVVIAPFCMILFFWGGGFVTALYGKKYSGNGLIVSVLAFNFLVTSLAFSPSRALITIERADVDFKINFLMLFFLLSVGLFLVRSFGPVGAAFGLLTSNLICLIFRYIAFLRFVHLRIDSSRLEPESPHIHLP